MLCCYLFSSYWASYECARSLSVKCSGRLDATLNFTFSAYWEVLKETCEDPATICFEVRFIGTTNDQSHLSRNLVISIPF